MKYQPAWMAVVALGLLGTGAPARADLVLANNLSPSPGFSSYFLGVGFAGSTANGLFTNEVPVQEFTAAASGVITTIEATIGQSQPDGVPLTVAVLSESSSLPGAVLGSVTFASSQVSSNPFLSNSIFDLSSAQIALTAGQNYFVRFSVGSPIDGNSRYAALLLDSPNPIAFGFPGFVSPDGGITWLTPSPIPNEIGLRINGTPPNAVPEPSSVALAGLGAVALGVVGSRRRRR